MRATIILIGMTLVACNGGNTAFGDAGNDANDGGIDVAQPPEAGLVVLATDGAAALALTATTVLWFDPVVITGAIKQCTKSGGAASTLVQNNASGLLAADAINVYWTNGASVMQCPAGGCSQPITLWTDLDAGPNNPDAPQGLAIDSANVYWSLPNGSILSCAIGGCAKPTFVYSTTGLLAGAVAVDANNVYWWSGNINSCPKTGCATPTVLASNVLATAIAVDGANVYWASSGSVWKCAAGGCNGSPTPLASYGQGTVGTLVTDGANVYWTIPYVDNPPYPPIAKSGSVGKCSVNGCGTSPTFIVSQADDPWGLAVDDTSLYFTVGGGPAASVMKLTPK